MASLPPDAPALEDIADAVRQESALALTLGAALLGASASTLVSGPGLVPLLTLVILGLTGWAVSNPAAAPGRLGIGALAGTVVALAVARVWSAHVVPFIPLVAPATLGVVLFALSLFARIAIYVRAGSHEDGTLARLAATRWLLVVAVLTGAAAGLLHSLGLAAASTLVGLFAAVRWALGRDAQTSLAQWLDRVRQEDFAAWRIISADAVDSVDALELRPLLRMTPLDGILIRVGDGGPYRGLVGGTPVALVPLHAGRPALPRPRLAWQEVGFLVASIFVVALPYVALSVAGELASVIAPRGVTGLSAAPGPLELGLAFAITLAGVTTATLLARHKRSALWTIGAVSFVLTAMSIARGLPL